MSGARSYRAKAAAIVAVAVLASLAAASDPDASPALDPRERALAEIRAEVARLEKRLSATRARESTLGAALERTEVELALQEQQLAEATAALELSIDRAAAADQRARELAVSLVGVQESLRRRLAGLYRLGRQGYLRLFLSLEPESSLLPAIRQLRYLARRDRDLIDRYRETRQALEDQRRALAVEREAIVRWREEEQARHQALRETRARQARLLRQAEEERRTLSARAEALAEKARKLASFIATLVDDQAALEGQPIQDFAGVLDWPARGDVAVPFGPRKDPRYRTEVPHNGIDLTLDAGTRVHVVYPGKVLFAGAFEGYGQMVVVHHPGRVFTLYAGLVQVGVHKGDVLSLGADLGASAETLYFEIRRDNAPEDPQRWLR